MWLFNHKILVRESGLLEGFRDCHCHLLPGVDDGVKDLEDTLLILGDWEIAGVKEVWMTPHIMEDIPNRPEVLLRKFEQVKAAYGGGVKLHLAAEHMLDGLFLKRIDVGEVMAFDGLPFNKNKNKDKDKNEDSGEGTAGLYKKKDKDKNKDSGAVERQRQIQKQKSLTPDPSPEGEGSENEKVEVDVGVDVDKGGKLLVETSYYTPPMNMGGIMEDIMKRGYEPILAHPERYQYMDVKDYKRWKNMGVMLQLNVPSVVGAYGPEVQRKAEWLLKENMYDFCGTDTHSVEQVGLLLNSLISKKTVKRIQAIPNEL